MTEPLHEPTPTPMHAARRPWRRLGWFLPLLLALPLAIKAWHDTSGSHDILASLAAKGLPTTPDQLNRWYAQLPPGENMALPILDAAGAVRGPGPKATNYPYFHGRYPWLHERSPLPGPPQPVPPDDLAQWKKLVDGMPEAWAAMERARGRKLSRFPVDLRGGLKTLLPHLSPTKRLAQACALRALVAAEELRPHDAALAISDGLLVYESLLPEPLMISQLVAAAALHTTLHAASDVLSVTPLPEESLRPMQRKVESLATTNRIMGALLGEMCLQREIFRGSPAAQGMAMGMAAPGTGSTGQQLAAAAFLALYSATGLNAADERFHLAQLERMIAASSLPWPQPIDAPPSVASLFQPANEDAGLPAWTRGRMKSRMILPSMDGFASQDGESLARLRIAAAMFAIERFRLAHDGRLPQTLGNLVPDFIASVPLDPFDSKPIRYKPSSPGYSLHSIGKDRKDDDARPPQRSKTGSAAEPDVVLRVRR